MSVEEPGRVGRLVEALRDAAPAAVLLVGIDDVHDLRHRAGWEVAAGIIDHATERVRRTVGDRDEVIEIEPGALLVVRPGRHDPEVLDATAHDLVRSVTAADGEPDLLLRAAVGVSGALMGPRDDPGELLADLAGAVGDARRYPDRVHVLDTADRRARALARAHRRALPEAIARDQLQLWYQPKIDLVSRRLIGFEALARWPDPSGDPRPPASFIPLLEENEAIVPFGRWALERAITDLRSWHDAGAEKELSLSVNISARQLVLDDVPASLARATARGAVDPARITVELTETAIVDDLANASAHLAAIREAGARVSLDDFGTGFSSLALLRRLPFDEVKIDRSFVAELGVTRGDTALVQGMISLSHRVGRIVVAEGVETLQQLGGLLQSGCDQAQGYLFSRPVEPARASELAIDPNDLDRDVAEMIDRAASELDD
ncbi:MAG: EAL domain-containing protein [Actinomycetota bacterium]